MRISEPRAIGSGMYEVLKELRVTMARIRSGKVEHVCLNCGGWAKNAMTGADDCCEHCVVNHLLEEV